MPREEKHNYQLSEQGSRLCEEQLFVKVFHIQPGKGWGSGFHSEHSVHILCETHE